MSDDSLLSHICSQFRDILVLILCFTLLSQLQGFIVFHECIKAIMITKFKPIIRNLTRANILLAFDLQTRTDYGSLFGSGLHEQTI